MLNTSGWFSIEPAPSLVYNNMLGQWGVSRRYGRTEVGSWT